MPDRSDPPPPAQPEAAAPAPEAPLGPARTDDAPIEAAIELARLLKDNKCEDILVLDVRSLSQVTDAIVIGTGTSERQMASTGEDIEELATSLDHPVMRSNTDARTTWVIVDCVDVVVHLFEPNTRAHYDLEMLWGDAPRIEWRRES